MSIFIGYVYGLAIHVIMIASCVTKTFKPSTASGTDHEKKRSRLLYMVVIKQVGGMLTNGLLTMWCMRMQL